MFCEKCGKELKDDWKKCPYCGQIVVGDVVESNVKTEQKTEIPQQASSLSSERVFQDRAPKKKGSIKKVLLGIGVVFLILIVVAVIIPSEDEDNDNNKKSQEASQEIKTLEEAGGFEQWKKDGFPGRVRTNITVNFPLVNTDKNNYVVLIEGGIGVIMQEDEKPVKEWEWLMSNELDEDTQNVEFNGILKYLGQKDEDEFPVFLISDVGEGTYWEDDGTYDTQKEEDYTNSDLEWLIGQPEEVLEELGFTYHSIWYTNTDGGIIADCIDGKVNMIYITDSADDTLRLHGVRIGMSLKEADGLLTDRYNKMEEFEVDTIYHTVYIDKNSGNEVELSSDNGVIAGITITHYTEEQLQEQLPQEKEAAIQSRQATEEQLQEQLPQEYIFQDSNSRYLSEEEIRNIEADKLRIARNEIFAKHGYIFNDEELNKYFNNTSWYEGTIPSDQFDMDAVLNDFEKKNVELIGKVEDELNGEGNRQETFIGKTGTYLTTYYVDGFTPRIDILEIEEDTLTFTLGVLGHPTNMLEETAQIIDSNTAQLDYYGFVITLTWTDTGNIYVTHQGELTGMDSGIIIPATDAQKYIWAEEFN